MISESQKHIKFHFKLGGVYNTLMKKDVILHIPESLIES